MEIGQIKQDTNFHQHFSISNKQDLCQIFPYNCKTENGIVLCSFLYCNCVMKKLSLTPIHTSRYDMNGIITIIIISIDIIRQSHNSDEIIMEINVCLVL